MRKLILIGTVLTLMLACGSNKGEVQETKKEMIETTFSDENKEEVEYTEAKDCDEFIDQYEAWMDDYLDLLDKYMKNPMDASLMEEYMEVAEEGTNWMMQWNTRLIPCSSKEKYQKRFDEISEKADAKMAAMGLD